MSAESGSGTILIRQGTLLPAGLTAESGAFLPGWGLISDIDVYGLGRKLAQAHWNFFYMAGETKAIAWGREGQEAERRAARRILGKLKQKDFNCLEITKVIAKRFLGIPFLSVAANVRHIQESMYLILDKKLSAKMPVAATPREEMDSAKQIDRTEGNAKPAGALISGS
jgi:hypothetical protein